MNACQLILRALLCTVPVLSLPFRKIDTRDKRVVEIASDTKDYDEQSENEMIQPADLADVKSYVEDERSRYEPLHSYVESYNKRGTVAFLRLEPKIWESSIEEDDEPFLAGFKDGLDREMIGANDKDKRNVGQPKDSLDAVTEPGEETYDYYEFKKEYDAQLTLAEKTTESPANSSGAQPEPERSSESSLDFPNCTQGNWSSGSGIEAIDCFLHKYRGQKTASTLRKLWPIVRICFFIYICFAIPCWCHRGWCCCCFRCKVCHPRKRIRFARQYYVDNPPGIITNATKKGEKDAKEPVTYEPTELEEEAYESFRTAIRNI